MCIFLRNQTEEEKAHNGVFAGGDGSVGGNIPPDHGQHNTTKFWVLFPDTLPPTAPIFWGFVSGKNAANGIELGRVGRFSMSACRSRVHPVLFRLAHIISTSEIVMLCYTSVKYSSKAYVCVAEEIGSCF